MVTQFSRDLEAAAANWTLDEMFNVMKDCSRFLLATAGFKFELFLNLRFEASWQCMCLRHTAFG